jgi:hypothetical protein
MATGNLGHAVVAPAPDLAPTRFGFEFDARYRGALALFGVDGATASMTIGSSIGVRFGRWRVGTPLHNVAGASITGPYSTAKVIGPHWSVKDGGVTFGTNARRGLCLRFVEPVRGLDPFRWLLHPNMTITLADPDGALRALREAGAKVDADPSPTPAPRRSGSRGNAERGLALRSGDGFEQTDPASCVDVPRVPEQRGPAPHQESIAGQGSERDKQPSSEGQGPLFIRKYRAAISGSSLDAHELIAHLAAEPNRGAPVEIA